MQYKERVSEAEESYTRYQQTQKSLASASQELSDWKTKYEELNLKKSTEEARSIQENPEISSLRQRIKSLERELNSERIENDNLRAEVERVEREKSKLKLSLSSDLKEQFELLESNMGRKDQEVARLRQTNQLLQTNIDELSLEFEKIRLKTSNDFKASEGEKVELNNKIITLEVKAAKHECRVAGTEEVKALLQQQANTLSN